MAPRGARAAAAVAMLLAAPFLLFALGAAPFDDPGEGMHAEIARELRLSGDPLDLRLGGVRYVDKPPLLYVLMAMVFAVAGESEAAARVVPALAALAAVGATAWLGARLLGFAGGVMAGGALLTSAGFFAYGRYVRPETLFVATIAIGFALALVGLAEQRRAAVAAGLTCFGVAALAKDPLGAVGPPAVIGLALALGRRARPVRRWLPWTGVAAAALLAFGWWLVVEARSPGFTWYTIVDNHFLNVVRARQFPDEDVPLSALQFLAVAGAGALPWILSAVVTTAALIRQRAWRAPEELPWIALGLWIVAVLALTTLSPFRLPHYGLPAYPAIALLAARAWLVADRRRLVVLHAAAFAAVAAACALAWASGGDAFARHVLDVTDVATRKAAAAGHAAALPPWEAIRPLFGATAVSLGLAAVLLAWLAARRSATAPAPAVVLAAMLAVLPCVGLGLVVVSSHRAVRGLAAEVARRAAPEDVLVHEGPLENSGALEWYAKRRPVIVDGERSVLAFGATLDGAGEIVWAPGQFRRAWEGPGRIWVVTTRAPEQSPTAALPGARLVTASAGRRLYVNR